MFMKTHIQSLLAVLIVAFALTGCKRASPFTSSTSHELSQQELMALTNYVQQRGITKYPIFTIKEVGVMVRTGDITNINTWVNYFLVQTPTGWKLVYSQRVSDTNNQR
jgi:predicted small lipoprotein YifL